MTSATPKSIRDVTLGELSAAARAAGLDAAKRAAAVGLKVTTLGRSVKMMRHGLADEPR